MGGAPRGARDWVNGARRRVRGLRPPSPGYSPSICKGAKPTTITGNPDMAAVSTSYHAWLSPQQMRWRTHCTVSSRSYGSLTFGTFHATDNRGRYQKGAGLETSVSDRRTRIEDSNLQSSAG